MPQVLVCDSLPDEAVSRLRRAGLDVEVATGLSPAALRDRIASAHGVIVRSATKITKEAIAAGTVLRVIGRAGVGLDNVDVAAARERGIAVVNTPSATSASVAELAIGLMFALARRIPAAHAATSSGAWEKKAFEGIELGGKTLGLVGFGAIAREVARRARALGLRVVCNRKRMAPDDEMKRLEIDLMSLDHLLACADIVSIHVPLTLATQNLLGRAQLASMKKGAFLVNCARGGVVDETALAELLAGGHIGGAAVDVFSEEPIRKDNPLLSAPRVILTPHIGASTREGQIRAGTEIADLVIRHLTA